MVQFINGQRSPPVSVILAANDHLFVSLKSNSNSPIQYQFSANRKKVFYISRSLLNASTVAIGKAQNHSQLYFVTMQKNGSVLYMSKVTVTDNEYVEMDTVTSGNLSKANPINRLVLSVEPRGQYAIAMTDSFIFIRNLFTRIHWIDEIVWPNSTRFTPVCADMSARFVYMAGYEKSAGSCTVTVYLMSVDFSGCRIQFHDRWQSELACSYDHLDLSLSVSEQADEKILLGIPTINSVYLFTIDETPTKSFRLQHLGTKRQDIMMRDNYGTSVVWLNNGQRAAVLDTADLPRDSVITARSNVYIYDSNNMTLFITNATATMTFPNFFQKYTNQFKPTATFMVATQTTPSTLYLINQLYHILVLLPSDPGYYSVESFFYDDIYTNHVDGLYFLYPNRVTCPVGTYKNDAGIWPCSVCKADNTSLIPTCLQCQNRSNCPLEFAMTEELMSDVTQSIGYPETAEIDVFDDILFYNMFRTDCGWKSPIIMTAIVLSIVVLLSMLICSMNLSKRFRIKQQFAKNLFKHFDLIEQGKFWFGGLISISALFFIGFLVQFSVTFHTQYSMETKHSTCQTKDLLNAKFETSLRFLNSPAGDHETVFNLLNSQ
ncbi:unnamed protein product, partial [Adineta ricciae]